MITIRNIFYIVLLSSSLYSCSTEIEEGISEQKATDILLQTDSLVEPAIDCDFVYDTIQDKKYKMHLLILDKYYNKEKRGYFFTSNGDTVNNFLYHQDIAVFMNGLDPAETGLYKKLTNKVIFLILEHDPQMLDYGLTQWTKDVKDLDYFMEHVSHPICNTIPIDSIVNLIKVKMGEPHEGAKKVKQMLFDNLKQSKK